MGHQITFSREKIGGWVLALAMAVVMLLAATLLMPGEFFSKAYANSASSITYTQADGYQPYQGWQDSPWDEASDPWYSSSGGTTRKGYPAWSLTAPLSKGVTGYDGRIVTGSSVSVVTDMNKTDTSGLGTYDNPYYYKNIILPSYDANASELQFTLSYVGAGGVNPVYLFDGHGGLLITKSDDPATWSDPANVVWEGNTSNVSVANTSDNWWKNIVCTVDASTIDPNQTYYFVIKNGTAGQWARLYANIVFEFNTYTDKTFSWEGDETRAGYGREQGNGGTKLGIIDPATSDMTTDLSKIGYSWFNQLSSSLVLEDGGSTSVTIHADGSGSNWQSLSTWTGACASKVNVYDSDPTASGEYDVSSLMPVASASAGTLSFFLENPDRDWPSYDGVKITMSGLKSEKTYYLVFSPDLQPQTTRSLGKPIVLEFTTAAVVNSWNVGGVAEADAKATLYSDGQLVFSGTGDLKVYEFSGASQAPWRADAYKSMVKSVRFEGVSPTSLWSYFLGCENLVTVSNLPVSVTNMEQTFSGCTSLKTVAALPQGVKNLRATFATCTSLTEAPEIPSGVENIESLFFDCKALVNAPVIPASVTDMTQVFRGCAVLEAMPSIPNGVVTLESAFHGCASLKTTTVLPESVENMVGTFLGCTSLEVAPVLPSSLKTITNLFAGCTSLKVVSEIPASVEGSLFGTFQNCIVLETGPSKIPAGVTNMWRAFQNCRSLKQAPELSSGLENMKETFQNCTALTKAPVIPDTVTNMQGTFQNCSGISEAPLIPGKVTTLSNTFSGCSSLVRLPADFSIPASVTNKSNTFKVATPYSETNLLDTYTESKDASLAAYNWTASNRKLIVQDFAALTAALTDAGDVVKDMVTSADGKDIANGSPYVAPADLKAFSDAVVEAQAVAANTTATQDDIDAAVQALAAAKTALSAAVETAVTDVDSLNASLGLANDAKGSVQASTDGLDVAAGKKWATQASIDQLKAVIDVQQIVASRTTATQNEVDAAQKIVDDALKAFSDMMNTASPSTVALASAVAEAGAAAKVPMVSVDGKDVAHGKTWCKVTSLSDLNDAIDDAQAIVDAVAAAARNRAVSDTSQNGVDAGLTALNTALTTFNANVKTAAVDTSSLSAAFETGDNNLATTVISTDGADVFVRSQWVTKAQADVYRASLTDARVVVQDAARTQNAADAAEADLALATTVFDAAKKSGLKVDVSVLGATIEEAAAQVASAVVADEAQKVAAGTLFVSQRALDTYNASIAQAKLVLANAASTQDEVDAAVKLLIDAQSAFDASKQTGAATSADDVAAGSGAGVQGGSGQPSSAGAGKVLVSTGDYAASMIAFGAALTLAGALIALIARRRLRRL